MAEYDNNNQTPNDQGNNHQNSNQNPNNKMPEYSFWAEQMPGNSNMKDSYTNQGNAQSYFGNSNQPYSGNPNMYQQNGYGYSNMPNTNYSQPNYQNFNRNTNPYGYYNQGNNTGSYGNQPNMNQTTSYNSYKVPKKEQRAGGRVFKFIGKALSFGIIAALAFVGIQQLVSVIAPNSQAILLDNITEGSIKEAPYQIGYTTPGAITTKDQSDISGIVDKTMPAIVTIDCTATETADWFGQQYSQEVEGSGSGFIVKKTEKELLIATNNHVVEGASKIKVTFIDGKTAEAVIKGTDAVADLAVISIDLTNVQASTLEAIKIAKLGNSDDVKVGEIAIAIGNALGYGQSVTVGYISAKNREVQVSDGYNATKTMVLLQTDAAINPGNSGGALLDINGDVIGINTVKYASTEVEGIGYAIPISNATSIINELMTREILAEKDQGYLGIGGNDVTEDVAQYYQMPIGVFINELAKGGAAEKAGLLPGDIITKVDNIEVTAITQLREYVTSKRVGTKVEITYMRKSSSEYKEGKVTVTLGKNPSFKSSEE